MSTSSKQAFLASSNTIPLASGSIPDTSFFSPDPISAMELVVNEISSKDITFKGHSEGITCSAIEAKSNFLLTGSLDKSIIVWNLETHFEEHIISGFTGAVNTLDISADGQLLACGSQDGYVKVFDILTKTLCFTFRDQGPVLCASFSANGLILAIGASDGTIKVWPFRQKHELFSLFGHTKQVNCVKFLSTSQIISSSNDCSLKIWDFKEKKAILTLFGHSGPVNCLALDAGSSRFASGSDDSSIKIWNGNSEKEDLSISIHKESVRSLCFSLNGMHLASASDDSIKIFDLFSKHETVLFGHNSIVTSLKYFNVDKCLISTSLDKTVKIWSLDAYKHQETIRPHQGPITAVCYSYTGKWIATGSNDCLIKIWNILRSRPEMVFSGHSRLITCIKFTSADEFLISASLDCLIKIWNTLSKKIEFTLNGHSSGINSLAVSANDRFILTASEDKSLKIWDFNARSLNETLLNSQTSVEACCFSPVGEHFACVGQDGVVKIWSSLEKAGVLSFFTEKQAKCLGFNGDGLMLAVGFTDGFLRVYKIRRKEKTGSSEFRVGSKGKNEDFALKIHSKGIEQIIWQKRKNRIITCSLDSTIKIVEIDKKFIIISFQSHLKPVFSISLSLDEQILISGSGDFSAKIWRLSNKSAVCKSQVHHLDVLCIAISKNYELIATGSSDKSIKLCFFKSFKEKHVLNGHFEAVLSLDFSIDSAYLVSGSEDRTVRVWDVSKGCEEICFKGHLDAVASVRFLDDCKTIISASADRYIRVWNFIDRKEETGFKGHLDRVNDFLILESRKMLISCSDDFTIKFWRLSDRKVESEILNFREKIVKIEKDGTNRFLAACSNRKIKVYDIIKENEELEISTKDTLCLCFTSCNSCLLSGTAKGKVKLWNLNEKCKEYSFQAHKSAINSVLFAELNSQFLTGAGDGRLKLWDFSKRFSFSSNDVYKKFNRSQNPPAINAATDKFSVNNPDYYPFLEYSGVLFSLKYGNYSILAEKNLKYRVSPYGFTFLHIVAFLGISELEKKIKHSSEIVFKTDAFGHSPLFYSVSQNHQKLTNSILKSLIQSLSIQKLQIQVLHSIRNDFSPLVKNSPKFLSFLLYALPVTYSSGSIMCQQFLTKSNTKKEIYSYCLMLPKQAGSLESIDLVKGFLGCKNDEIFKTEFVFGFLRNRWEGSKTVLIICSTLIWVNWVLMAAFLSYKESAIGYIIILVNIILLIKEMIRIAIESLSYIEDFSNFFEVSRLILTISWVIFFIFHVNIGLLSYLVLLMNSLSGFYAFRIFKPTRFLKSLFLQCFKNLFPYYIILIYSQLSFGLLFNYSNDSPFALQNLWFSSFGIFTGETNQSTAESTVLFYFSYYTCIFVNVLLVGNLAIPILLNSYQKYLNDFYVLDCKEMGKMIIEASFLLMIKKRKIKYEFLKVDRGEGMNKKKTLEKK